MIKKGIGNIYDFNKKLIIENVKFRLDNNILEITEFDYHKLDDSQEKFLYNYNNIRLIIKSEELTICINSSFNNDYLNKDKIVLKIYDKMIFYNDIKYDNINNIETTLFNFIYDECSNETIKLKKFEIEFKKLSDYEESVLKLESKKSNFEETCVICIKNIQIENIDEKTIINVINDLCDFLSYITCNKVSYYRIHYLNNENQIFMNTLDFNYPPYFIDEIPFKSKGHTRSFSEIKYILEHYYDKYELLMEDYPFNVIFGFYLDALNQNYLEMKYLTSMTCLETILDSFEKLYSKNNDKKIKQLVLEKRNEEGNKIIRKSIETKLIQKNKNIMAKDIDLEKFYLGNDKLSEIRKGGNLPELIEKILYFEKYYDKKIGCDVSNFIKIRNKITHTGKIPQNINNEEIDPVTEYDKLRKVLNEMILVIFKT